MDLDLIITKFLPIERSELFAYFTKPELLEQWCYPDGMALKIPVFEPKIGGQYRYEHTSADGIYVCLGFIQDLVPNEKIVQLDESIRGPDGKKLFSNLTCMIEFEDKARGTEVSVTQSGFVDQKSADECEQGWTQCLDHLAKLIIKREALTPSSSLDPDRSVHSSDR